VFILFCRQGRHKFRDSTLPQYFAGHAQKGIAKLWKVAQKEVNRQFYPRPGSTGLLKLCTTETKLKPTSNTNPNPNRNPTYPTNPIEP